MSMSEGRSAAPGRLVVYGAGGFGLEVLSYVVDRDRTLGPSSRGRVVAIVDEGTPRLDDARAVLGHDVAFHRTLETLEPAPDLAVLVCVGDAVVRDGLHMRLATRGFTLASLIHPTAYVATTASVAAGAIVAPFAFIGPFALVEPNSVVNVYGTVGHDAVLGRSAVLSPYANMNGASRVGRAAFLGAGAALSPGARLGPFSKLSAGSILNGTTEPGVLAHGNPAKWRRMYRLPDDLEKED